MSLQPLLDASPAIQLHTAAALAALLLGAAILFRRKGDRLPRVCGRLWVASMLVVAVSSFFIHSIRLWGAWSPIHLLSLVTILSLAYAVAMIRKGRTAAHAAAMRGTYVGALIVAGLFTLLPGRIMNGVLFAGSGHGSVSADQGPSILAIIAHTPIWVWPLLGYVVYAGWKASTPRLIAPWQLLPMPILAAGLALYNLVASNLTPMGFGLFIGGLAGGTLAGLAMARRRPARPRNDGQIELDGDWLPLVLWLGVFALGYARGIMLGIDPGLATDPAFRHAGLLTSGLFAALVIAQAAGVLLAARPRFSPAGQSYAGKD